MTTEEASDFPSPPAIQQIHNCPGPIPLKEAQKLVDWLLHIGWLRRYLCGNGFNRLRHSLTRNPIPGIVPYNNKGACNYQLPPKEQSLERTSSAPALQAAPRGTEPPQITSFWGLMWLGFASPTELQQTKRLFNGHTSTSHSYLWARGRGSLLNQLCCRELHGCMPKNWIGPHLKPYTKVNPK